MEPLGTALVFLVQFWVLQGTAGLSVQQGPKLPQVREDSQVTLARQVVQSQAWGQQLRVGWKKDGVFLCDSHVTKGRFSLGVCGPRWQLSWESRGNLNLNVTPASSSLQLASPPRNSFGNSFSATRRDQLQCENTQNEEVGGTGPHRWVRTPGRAAGGRGRGRGRGRGDSGVASGGEGAGHPHGGPDGSIRSLSRRPPDPQPRLAQKPCPSPSPGPPISTVGVSPDPRPSGQQKPRGLLEEGSEPRKDTPPPPVAT
ncbi:transmembrane and immunoglobulin domain-containing protein 2 [Neofelis nebulosa]|uniref:transmembrane and immunoglobulin domain-containing protein 2 n=1 Tax=Neofelis nebulosa TaxID=61452 RepID=UPI00272B38D5|nr:transmembrane and immunoglobulin domain-containing protein 2 [Neofelis nebulosa]